jgi:hypothetical protein
MTVYRDGQVTQVGTPGSHILGGTSHSSDTLANLNSKISDLNTKPDLFGEAYISSSSATTTSQTPTFTKVAGTYTSGDLNGFTHSAGVLTYTGSVTRKFKVLASLTSDVNQADVFEFQIYKNSTGVVKSEQHRQISVNDVGAFSLCASIELATNDTVEVRVARQSGVAANLIADHLHIIIEALN